MNQLTITPILIEKEVDRHSYLMTYGLHHVLLDPGAHYHSDALLRQVQSIIAIDQIEYIILQSNDFLNISSLDAIVNAGFKGTLIVNEASLSFIRKSVKVAFKTIQELDNVLMLDDVKLTFVPTPFLPFPENYVTYIQTSGLLFSSHLFSSYPGFKSEKRIDAISRFHEQTLPSSDFVRHALKKLKGYDIHLIFPRLGAVIEQDEVGKTMQTVADYDFYNTTQIIEKKSGKRINYNYETICNHMLRKLATQYRRQDITAIFKNSEFKISLTPSIEIEESSLSGYRLYNRFFEIIFEKKGVEWLALLELSVNKYSQLYSIKKPAIYETVFYQQKAKIDDLSSIKQDLEAKVASLKTTIDQTSDRLLRCPLTGLYNQVVMNQHLLDNLDQPLPENATRALLVIHIDNLLSINKKYGTAKGDDTLRGLVHEVNKIKSEDTLVFKQNGPGIFVYKHEVNPKDLLSFALKLKNAIKSSDIFIEPVTVSVAIVETSELNQVYGLSDRVTQLVELALSRLERAKLKGKDGLFDKDNDRVEYTDGVILLVDEDETNQNLMMTIFKRINYQVIIAKDIYQAYEMIENNTIDLIISEINLSKLDGFQLKQKLNATKDYQTIPFIIVSHHKNLNVITRCNLLNIDLVLQKPIIPEELIGHVKRLKERRTHL